MLLRSLLALALCAVPFSASAEPSSTVPVLQQFVESRSLAGAVTLVASRDRVLSVETTGFMDVAARTPMRADAMFWIASMSKPITAAAFMMLVDEGRVQLDDPVEKLLPEFKELWVAAEQDKEHVLLRRPSHAITVREILSHTSGLQFKSGIEQPTLDQVPLRLAVLSHPLMPLLFQPGTNYRYSNAGINTAGRLIEVLSGQSYEQFLQQRLFDPLGMKDTTFWPNEEQVARLAKAYKPNDEKTDLVETPISQLTYPLTDRTRQPMPGGGLFSTADDVAKFCQMLLNGGVAGGRRLLSEAAIRDLTTRQTPASVKESYGLGFKLGDGTYGHGGAYATNMTVDAKRGLVLVFMVQLTGGKDREALPAFTRAAVERFGTR